MRIYLYYYGHNGDALTTRPIVRKLKEMGHTIALGVYANHAYLFSDLGVALVKAPFDDDVPLDVSQKWFMEATLIGHKPLSVWCGTYRDLDVRYGHNWANIVLTINRQMSELGLEIGETPMIDFDINKKPVKVNPNWIYLETSHVRSGHCYYEFDLRYMARTFKHLEFYCTGKRVPTDLKNLHNVSKFNLIELSGLSNSCAAIVGKGSGPFLATFTEPNRFKPRAVVGFKHTGVWNDIDCWPFWDYTGANLLKLKDETELCKFLEGISS